MMRIQPVALALAALLGGCPQPPDTDTDTDSNTDVDTDSDTEADTDTDAPVSCFELPSTLPAWSVAFGTTAPANDAGIAAVKAAAQATLSDDQPDTVSLAVTNAQVSAIGYTPDPLDVASFWIADANGAIHVYLGAGNGAEIVAGDTVSFTATEVTNYGGDLEVTKATGLTRTQAGATVYAKESNGHTLSYATDGGYLHHMWGELSNESTCGATCFDFTTRDSGGTETTMTFRIRNENLSFPLVAGDCVEMVAPLSVFNDTLQFDINNFGWQRWFGSSD